MRFRWQLGSWELCLVASLAVFCMLRALLVWETRGRGAEDD